MQFYDEQIRGDERATCERFWNTHLRSDKFTTHLYDGWRREIPRYRVRGRFFFAAINFGFDSSKQDLVTSRWYKEKSNNLYRVRDARTFQATPGIPELAEPDSCRWMLARYPDREVVYRELRSVESEAFRFSHTFDFWVRSVVDSINTIVINNLCVPFVQNGVFSHEWLRYSS